MRRLQRLRYYCACAILSLSLNLSGEGTKEVAPNANITILGTNTNDIAALHLDSQQFNDFAAYDNPNSNNRLHIHINDPSTESIYLGFSWGHLNTTGPNPTMIDFEYRIKDPNGNVVYGPINVINGQNGSGIINNWLQGFSGPAQLGNANGYNATQVSSLDAAGWTGAGDYYIEFFSNESFDGFLIDFWDLTVAKNVGGNMEEKKGRLWSNNWAFFAINDFGFPERPFNGSFYICSPDLSDPDAAFITQIDFNGSNFRPAAFNVAFNSFGTGNTGNIIVDRRSTQDLNATEAEFAIFLNDPVDICTTAEVGALDFFGISQCAFEEYCINFVSTKSGQVNVLLDLDGPDGVYTPGTRDILIVRNVSISEVGTTVCIPWDGLDGLGTIVNSSAGVTMEISLSFSQGINHFPIYDAEFLVNGYDINTIRPAGPKPKLFYDDSNIFDNSGSAEPKINFIGCDLPCHTWNNLDYGNLNTINSWWFSQQTTFVTELILPPFFSCSILGEDELCEGQLTSLSLDLSANPSNALLPNASSVTWSGPSIVGSNLGSNIQINQPGVYTATIEWTADGSSDVCTSTCTKVLQSLPSETLLLQEEICSGEYIEINGQVYDTTGTYEQLLNAVNECDTVLTIELVVLPEIVETIVGEICMGDDFIVNGESYSTPGPHTQTLMAANGCDSTLLIEIQFLPEIMETIMGEICEGESITYNGISYSTPGPHTQTLMAGNGCDSTLIIQLAILPNYEICTPYSIITGEQLNVNGQIYTETGTYQQDLTTVDGCDSILIIKLQVLPPPIPEVLVHYDLNDCKAGPSYNEFSPEYPADFPCSNLIGSVVSNPSGMSHSCTPGVDNSEGMCISSQKSCSFNSNSPFQVAFEIEIMPIVGTTVISNLSFYEKAPENFNWSGSDTGINDYPTYYGIRILKDNVQIYSNSQIATNREWTLQEFNFDGNANFWFSTPGTLRIELFPYCTIGNNSFVSAWDLDEISLAGYCRSSVANIQGLVKTADGDPMDHVLLTLSRGEDYQNTLSDIDGNYSFPNISGSENYTLLPYKNDDPLEGVNTLDLIRIQKHIFDIEKITDIEKLIAADINRSNSITAIDLVHLRNLILGVTDSYPSNTSWRFLEDAKIYKELGDVKDEISLNPIAQSINLKGIKIGDVDKSIRPTTEFQTEFRSENNHVVLHYSSKYNRFTGKSTYQIYASDYLNLEGIQMEIQLNNQKYVEIIPHKIPLKSYHNNLVTDGVRLCYYDSEISIANGDLLFELVFESENSEQLIFNTAFHNEIYAGEIMNLALIPFEDIVDNNNSNLEISAIAPNPIFDKSEMVFNSQIAEKLILEITDLNGIHVTRGEVQSVIGKNKIQIDRKSLPHSGVYIISIRNGKDQASKMITAF